MKTKGFAVFLLAGIILLIPNFVQSQCTGPCGDADGDGYTTAGDVSVLTDYLYISGTLPNCPNLADIDKLPGLSPIDQWYLIDHLYISLRPLSCPAPSDTTPPVYDDDRLLFRYVPNYPSNTWLYRIHDITNRDVNGIYIPISFERPGYNIVLDSVSFAESRYLSLSSKIDNVNGKVLIYSNGITSVTPAGEGMIATLYFSSPDKRYPPDFIIDTGMYAPEYHLLYTTMEGDDLIGYRPEFEILEYVCGDVDCSGGDTDISDATRLIDYFFLTQKPLCDSTYADVDNIPGITISDVNFILDYIYLSHQPLTCPPPPDTIPPPDSVRLFFLNSKVPPGQDHWQVTIWENTAVEVWGSSLPFSFDWSGGNISIDSIVLNPAIVERTYFDNVTQTGLIYNSVGQYFIGEDTLADIYFSLTPMPDSQYIIFDTAIYYPSHRLIYNRVNSSGEFIAFVPEINPGVCCYGMTGNTDCSYYEEPDISDIVRIIDNLYVSHAPLCCPQEANTNGEGPAFEPDISDISKLIDYLYLTHTPCAQCVEEKVR